MKRVFALTCLCIAGLMLIDGCGGSDGSVSSDEGDEGDGGDVDVGDTRAAVSDISAEVAVSVLLEGNPNGDMVVLDVRTQSEYDVQHVKGAVLMDVNSGTFGTDIEELDKGKSYIVYCRSGVRSASAADTLSWAGFDVVHNVLGGLIAIAAVPGAEAILE